MNHPAAAGHPHMKVTQEAIMTRNRSWSGARIARAAAIAIWTFAVATSLFLLPATRLAQAQGAHGATGDVEAVLAQYGTFVHHQKYGEVWVPRSTPPGLHAYV